MSGSVFLNLRADDVEAEAWVGQMVTKSPPTLNRRLFGADGPTAAVLTVVDVASGETHLITDTLHHPGYVGWDGAGERLFFIALSDFGWPRLFVVSVSGEVPFYGGYVPQTEIVEATSVSRDGRMIVTAISDDESPVQSLWIPYSGYHCRIAQITRPDKPEYNFADTIILEAAYDLCAYGAP